MCSIKNNDGIGWKDRFDNGDKLKMLKDENKNSGSDLKNIQNSRTNTVNFPFYYYDLN
jgi:hypothetical protein